MVAAAVVNVGTQANDATGDLLRDAFIKINMNFAALFAGNFPAAQLTVGPPVSGTALSVVALAGQNAISTTIGGVNFATPSSGNTLTVGGFSGSTAIVANAASATDLALFANGNVNLGGSTASSIAITGGVTIGSPTGGNKGSGSLNAASIFVNNVAVFAGTPVTTFTSNTGLSANVAATGAVTVTNTGVLSITGTANQIAASASTGAITLSIPQTVIIPTGAANAYSLQVKGNSTSGQSLGFLVSAGTTSADAAIAITNQSGGVIFLEIFGDGHGNIGPSASLGFNWTTTGNISIPAPSSGDNLLLTNVAGGNALTVAGNSAGTAVLRLNTQATTGAQTATFAASNKPGSGTTGPDKWIPVNLDGTTHYVPAFL